MVLGRGISRIYFIALFLKSKNSVRIFLSIFIYSTGNSSASFCSNTTSCDTHKVDNALSRFIAYLCNLLLQKITSGAYF